MEPATDATPLLGRIHLPGPIPGPAEEVLPHRERVHYLDNLRAVLTVLLIFHHAAMEAVSSRVHSKWESLPLALFITIDSSLLWGLFFFVSGYSAYLSLSSKSDSKFLISRTMKLGLPAVLYILVGRRLLLRSLDACGWEHVFGDYHSVESKARMTGPVAYVFFLLAFDYAYLAAHWIGRRYADLTARIQPMPKTYPVLAGISFEFVLFLTFARALGLGVISTFFYNFFPYDFPGLGAPATFIVAYVAGVYYPLYEKHLLLSFPAAMITLVGSELLAYFSLGIAQHLWPALWDFIKPIPHAVVDTPRFAFVDGGFNLHTLFFTFWSTLVFYALSISLVSVFAKSRVLSRDWGLLTKHTYFQTYIHMIPILVMLHLLPSGQNPIVKTVLAGVFGVIDSWGVAFLLMGVYWGIKRFARRGT
ncbi:hypothetical protein BDZ97DRAFT_1847726 [Flammula alnicola]|nr:hypothetical protein BDZ97DRAFT_1847726 [Flammula alnicola]